MGIKGVAVCDRQAVDIFWDVNKVSLDEQGSRKAWRGGGGGKERQRDRKKDNRGSGLAYVCELNRSSSTGN